MSGAFAQLGRVDTGEGESVSVDLEIGSREGDRVLLMATDSPSCSAMVPLTVPETLKLVVLLMEASNHLLEAQQDRAPVERGQ